jgi:hypothetical protein
VPLDGKPATPVLIRDGFMVPEWQRDGSSALFSAASKDNRAYSIHSLDLASGAQQPVLGETRGLDPSFAVSRTGSSIAYLDVVTCNRVAEPKCVHYAHDQRDG